MSSCIIMHHKTKFRNKMLGGLEDIIWTNINILTLRSDLHPECSNQFFCHRTLWLMIMCHQTKFACQGSNTSENIVERVTFWSYELVSWCFEPSQPQRITSGLKTNFTLSPSYSFHKSSYHKSCFFEPIYIPRAVNTGTCIRQGDLFYSAGMTQLKTHTEWN